MDKTNIATRIFGKGTVETVERADAYRPGDPRVVGPAPYGNVWVRSECFSITASRFHEGFSVDFAGGRHGTGYYPNGNIRNAVWETED